MYRIFICIVLVSLISCSCGMRVDKDKIKLEPTVSSTVEPSSDANNKDNKNDVNDIGDKKEDKLIINEETIIKLLSMDEKSFIELLGGVYTLNGDDSANLVYDYSSYGIEITYNTDLKCIVQIFIADSKIELFGVNNTMNFSTIKSILGEGELIVNKDYGTYILLYKYDKYKIQFYVVDDPENVKNNGFNIRQP